MNFGIPTKEEARVYTIDEHGESSWRTRALEVLHSNTLEFALVASLLLDVAILFAEIFLQAIFPGCDIIERDAVSCCPSAVESGNGFRLLAGSKDEELCPPAYFEGSVVSCDEAKWQHVHVAEDILFYITIAILSLFMIELTVSMVVLTPRVFLRQFFFLVDFVVTTVSLVLELVFYFVKEDVSVTSLVGLLVIIRIWRFIRIGHGLIEATHKLSQQETRNMTIYTKMLEDLCRKNSLELPAH